MGSVWRPTPPPWLREAALPTSLALPQNALSGCAEGLPFHAAGSHSHAKAPTAGHGGKTKVAFTEEAHNVIKS